MNISNIKNVISIRKFKLFLSIGFLVPVVLVYSTNIFESYLFNISKHFYAGFFIAIYLIIMIYWELKRPYFIQYIDEGDKITFRFYSLLIIGRKYKAYEIPKNSFKSFSIKMFFFNREESIILSRKTPTGIVDYQPLSLSAVSEIDRIKIKESLLKIVT
ncbi:MAG: hypothetical protein A2033_18610 [Bacteroidetes bacterium GWA2_31_9]|nr:MAG: hypothetical protein A2033_18610 [Bacteroidetes bacterium GWA2_31_9]